MLTGSTLLFPSLRSVSLEIGTLDLMILTHHWSLFLCVILIFLSVILIFFKASYLLEIHIKYSWIRWYHVWDSLRNNNPRKVGRQRGAQRKHYRPCAGNRCSGWRAHYTIVPPLSSCLYCCVFIGTVVGSVWVLTQDVGCLTLHSFSSDFTRPRKSPSARQTGAVGYST